MRLRRKRATERLSLRAERAAATLRRRPLVAVARQARLTFASRMCERPSGT